MSFSRDIKNEILSKELANDCCMLSFLSGLISSTAIFETNEKFDLFINTDLEYLPKFIDSICQKLYGEGVTSEYYEGYQIKKDGFYKIKFNENLSHRLLKDIGCVEIKNGKFERNFAVDKYMIEESHCLESYVKGVFVGCGTSSIKVGKADRLSTGYHLEFASRNYEFLNNFAHMLAQFDVTLKLIQRKKIYILYVKDANEVCNVLALVGAHNCVLELQNEISLRMLRNSVNRQTNCMNANINKTVEASFKQNDAIQKILITVGLDSLSEELQNIALLRMANPDESLDELIKLAKFKITKSALNYRLNKLIKIAEKL